MTKFNMTEITALKNAVTEFDPDYHPSIQGCIHVGWIDLVKDALKAISNIGWGGKITHISEKSGSLRIYVSNTSPSIDEIINSFEEKSRDVCCFCGTTDGIVVDGSDLNFVCDKHSNKKAPEGA